MLTRRDLLATGLKGFPLVALGSTVPGFLAATVRAAEAKAGGENALVVVELSGGNDGLNTVVPFADDLYRKARPKLGISHGDVIKLDDHVGLHPALRKLDGLHDKGQLAVVQGVGYPNPNRSHFESMDIWQTADPRGRSRTGWLAQSLGRLRTSAGQVPAIHIGGDKLPLALQGSGVGVPSLHRNRTFDVQGPGNDRQQKQQKLIRDLAATTPGSGDDLAAFVRRSVLDTYSSVDRLRDLLAKQRQASDDGRGEYGYDDFANQMRLIGGMIRAGFGARVYYLSLAGFDTHGDQASDHRDLLNKLAMAISGLFMDLEMSGDGGRVTVLTFSEFGRRVEENGSLGTDHGAASCMFVAGPGVQGGIKGKHPSLRPDDLDDGDLVYHTDFRQVYAAVLDRWLGCDSQAVLGGKFEHVPLFADRA